MPTNKKTDTDKSLYVWASLRISLGFIFLWAFLDKLIGLGFATCRNVKTDAIEVMCSKAWLEGGSPTTGFLKNAVQGPFAEFYRGLAGNTFIDWLFMAGLLGIGLALLLGVGVRVAAVAGSLLLLMMWTAALWPANNPVLDDHLVYILVLIGVMLVNNRQVWGLGGWWATQSVVKKFPLLK